MTVRVARFSERPDLDDALGDLSVAVWPEFMLHDMVCNNLWEELFVRWPEAQLIAYDDDTGDLVGAGNSIPFAWDGSVPGLPDGVDEVLMIGVAGNDRGEPPTTLSALMAAVAPARRGERISGKLIEAMRGVAAELGLTDLLAPVRPSWKSRYPLTPMDHYVAWRREDGEAFDPWIRTHERLGAETLAVCPGSMVVSGTVEQWESWSGMTFPETGAYVVPGALAPVAIDREAGVGRYVEPNVWMRHPVG
jgi:GNAT superfamily N-acetyltransferase